MKLTILCFAWLAFFTLHSLLASLWIKDAVKRRFPSFYPYYRLAYNLLSALLIVPILWFMHSINGEPLIVWEGPFHFISLGLGIIALAGFFWSSKYYDMSEFMGFRQISAKDQSAEKSDIFTLSPLHRVVRHPWYFLSLVILWTRDMNLPFLITVLFATLYFMVGSRLEDKKLLLHYGKRYVRYMALVPGLFPLPWRYLSKKELTEVMNL